MSISFIRSPNIWCPTTRNFETAFAAHGAKSCPKVSGLQELCHGEIHFCQITNAFKNSYSFSMYVLYIISSIHLIASNLQQGYYVVQKRYSHQTRWQILNLSLLLYFQLLLALSRKALIENLLRRSSPAGRGSMWGENVFSQPKGWPGECFLAASASQEKIWIHEELENPD